MQALIERIQQDAVYLGQGIVKVDGFINHQIDVALTTEMGAAFKAGFEAAGVTGITKIVTAEVSGIAAAFATAQAWGVPLIYARKHRPITMTDTIYLTRAPSHTKGALVELMISPQYLRPTDRVVLIDDFLASGQTIAALVSLIQQSGATLCGIGCMIEKPFEGGREKLSALNIPIITLARIDVVDDMMRVW